MKLTAHLAPLAFVAVSVAACVSGGGRGPSAAPPGDSSRDAPSDSPTADAPPADGEPTAATAPVDPPHPESAFTGAPSRPATPRPASAPYRVRVASGSMQSLPVFRHQGRTYVLGTIGERYAVTVSNPTGRRVEAVVSIDGLDAIDGAAADYVHKRGYIVPAHESLTIEGFRTSLDQVATFRFSSVADSYAGRLGQARDVGVIGVAFFPERPAPPQPVAPMPVPNTSRSDDGEGPADYAPGTPRASERPPSTSAANAESSSGRDLGGAAPPSPARKAEERRGLGTEFGESRESHVTEVPFVRADETSPSTVVVVRYNDRAGLLALGIPVDPPSSSDVDLRTRETADPFRSNRFAAPPPPR